MIVVMTTWLPRLAWSQPGMKAQTAPNAAAARMASGSATMPGRPAGSEPTSASAEAADIGLPLAADVEQAGVEGDGDGEAGEDEVGGVVERVADRLAVAERAVDQELGGLERVLADQEDDQPGDEEGEQRG